MIDNLFIRFQINFIYKKHNTQIWVFNIKQYAGLTLS